MQNYTAANVTAPDVVGNQGCAAESLVLDGHECKLESYDKSQ